MHSAGRFRNRSGQARIHREGVRELIDGQTVVDSERDGLNEFAGVRGDHNTTRDDLRTFASEEFDETIAMAEIRQKQRCLAVRLEKHEETICEKAQKLIAEAQDELHAAHEAWEQATQEHVKALRQKLESTREQIVELQHKVEQSVEDLRRAMNDWHDAHQGLVLKLA